MNKAKTAVSAEQMVFPGTPEGNAIREATEQWLKERKRWKQGRDLVVGDIIRVLSRFERIIALEPYEGVNRFLDGPEPARIARFPNGAGMTIFPNDWCEMEAPVP